MTVPVMRPCLGPEEAEAAAAVIASGSVAQGPRVAEFEAAFAAALGGGHAVAVSSGTAALHLALVASGIGPSDEVVVPSLSFIATTNAVRHAGAYPVFADVDEATLTLVPRTVARCLTGRTRAVIVADQAGVPADLDGIRALCEPRGIAVIEDAASAAGATYRGRPAGATAPLATFSFHSRMLLTTGEGGMIVTPDAAVAARLRRLREHGLNLSATGRHTAREAVAEKYLEVGFNYRMTDIQAAIGLVQLGKLPRLVARRRELAARYQELLAGLPGLAVVSDPAHGTANYQAFWVQLPPDFPGGQGGLLRQLTGAGIAAQRGVMAAHLEPAYADRPRPLLPVTERVTASSVILPLFHDLTAAAQDLVVSVIGAAAGRQPAARA